jgi:hypothetical protein
MPTSRTWIGGGNNSAANPKDWSPTGVPQLGDTLSMPGGTMNLTGHQLQSDPLTIPLGAKATIDITKPTWLTLDVGGYGPASTATVNLAANSQWIGGFTDGSFATTTVQGAGKFANTNSEVFGSALIRPDVVGVGTILAESSHGGGRIEFAHSVGHGQTVDIEGTGYHFTGGIVQVDTPASYAATTDLSFGQLLLEGMKASSYTYEDNIVSLFQGNAKTGHFTVVNSQQGGVHVPGSFTVAQVAGAIDIYKGNVDNLANTPLPLHG